VTLSRGRVLHAVVDEANAPSSIVLEQGPAAPRGRVVPRELVDASERARRILEDAETRATRLLEASAQKAADLRLEAEAQGRADGVAQVAARAVELAAHEARADERALERCIELARLLAERLLGEELALDPTRIVTMARQALGEARGARRVRIVAHPDDAAILERSRAELGLPPEAVTIAADEQRAQGELRLETEIGVLDAALAPQLDRLAQKLRGSLVK
jgi:flagellar biosynthesis/type III secretory pathway protein FliH